MQRTRVQVNEIFIPAWHTGDLDDEASDRVLGAYQRHLAGLLPDLPPAVQTLATSINIHDGLLWEAITDPKQASLRLVLRCGDLQVGYFDLELEYQQVDFVPELTHALRRLSVVRLDGTQGPYPNEAMHDEVDRGGEFLVHRILFLCNPARSRQALRRQIWKERHSRRQKRHRVSSWITIYQELTIQFKQLRLWITPRGSRHEVGANEVPRGSYLSHFNRF